MPPSRLPLLILLGLCVQVRGADLTLHDAPAQVYFSPRGGCTEAIVAALGAARKSVLVQAYSFTSGPIAAALIAAHGRGVEVRVILDKSDRTERNGEMPVLLQAGIPTWIDFIHAIAHNKVMVIDGTTVITGSFNFTKQAESRNAENLLILQDRGLARLYQANWENLRDQAIPCGEPRAATAP
jgi:phosphatidylserine/phosphatidylglycerophosphate/cardiolipin synthase-like enzyme